MEELQQANAYRSRYTMRMRYLGVSGLVLAGASTILGSATIALGTFLNIVGSSIWGSLLIYVPAGVLAILSVASPFSPTSRKRLATACLVMSILAAVMAFVNFCVTISSASMDKIFNPYLYWRYLLSAIIIDSVLGVLAVAEMVVGITAAFHSGNVMAEMRAVANIAPPGYVVTVSMSTHTDLYMQGMNPSNAIYTSLEMQFRCKMEHQRR